MSESIHTARWIAQIADLGWTIHLFPSIDCGSVHPKLRNVIVHHLFYRSFSSAVVQKGIPLLSKRLGKVADLIVRHIRWFDYYRKMRLKRLINRIKPDVVHSMEMQHAGYLTLDVKKMMRSHFPPWIVTNWGSDIYLFGRLKKHKDRIKEVLSRCNYYHSECDRDIYIAKEFGFKGKILPVIPNTGGFDLDKILSLRNKVPPSKRKLILLKGYQNLAGRALFGLRALERCADCLQGYTIGLYIAQTEDVRIASELFTLSTGVTAEIIDYTSHEEMLSFHAKARISIGLSISDAISSSFLEALVMGSFPIQSWTACADEWIVNGQTGILVHPEDPDEIENAIRKVISNDELVEKAFHQNYTTVVEKLDNSIIKPQIIEMYLKAAAQDESGM